MGLIDQPERTGLGWDFAGTVVATGPGVDLAVGTRVAGLVGGFDRDFGTYAEQLVVPAADLAVVPDGLDLVAASTVPLNGLAAAQIVDLLGDAPADGNRLLVTGAAGAVGGYVASLAQDRGWQVTGLARAEDEEFVRSLGADFTPHAEPGWDAVADGAVLQERGLALVRDGGAFVGVQPSAEPATRARDHRRRRGHRTPTALDWPTCSPAPPPANCRPACTRSCRWTRSPTPIERWPRAGCAVATCSNPDIRRAIRRLTLRSRRIESGSSGLGQDPSSIGDAALGRGRDAAARSEWAEAYSVLSAAVAASPAGPADLELFATAAYLVGHVHDSIGALQRAYDLHLEAGDVQQAVRCAFWLGFHLINGREFGQAEGWIARAGRVVDEQGEEGAAQGYLLLPRAFQQAVLIGDYAAAQVTAARAAEYGRRFGDQDVVVMALSIQGRSLLAEGRVREGLVALDEAMVAVVAGEVSTAVRSRVRQRCTRSSGTPTSRHAQACGAPAATAPSINLRTCSLVSPGTLAGSGPVRPSPLFPAATPARSPGS